MTDESSNGLFDRNLESALSEKLGEDAIRDWLAVDEHPVTIEDDEIPTHALERAREVTLV